MISIIVPVYKVEKYLDKCIESIVNQSYRDLEILLVDDGSPDNCPAMCDAWAQKDRRIKVIHKENGGVSSARNVGLGYAGGEYIGFVDSDDYTDLHMYEFLLANMTENHSDISVCSTFLVKENGDIQPDSTVTQQVLRQKEAVETISYSMNNSLWNKLFRRKVLGESRFDEGHTFGEDHLFLLKVLKNIEKISFVNVPLYYYVQRSNSTTNAGLSRRSFDQVYMKDALYAFVRENFPYIREYYRKLSFTARENLCRKILLSDAYLTYEKEFRVYQKYMKAEYSAVKSQLTEKEIVEYRMMCLCRPLYRCVFGKLLRKKRK